MQLKPSRTSLTMGTMDCLYSFSWVESVPNTYVHKANGLSAPVEAGEGQGRARGLLPEPTLCAMPCVFKNVAPTLHSRPVHLPASQAQLPLVQDNLTLPPHSTHRAVLSAAGGRANTGLKPNQWGLVLSPPLDACNMHACHPG